MGLYSVIRLQQGSASSLVRTYNADKDIQESREKIIELLNDSFKLEDNPNYAAWVLDRIKLPNYSGILIRDERDNILGFTWLELPQNTSEQSLAKLGDFCINSKYRGRGLGKKLAQEVLKYIKQKNLSGAYFDENMAMDFWAKIQECQQLKGEFGVNVWVLSEQDLSDWYVDMDNKCLYIEEL